MKFSDAQTAAYKAVGTNVIVSAGAGSGKTQVLSERVKYLVKEKDYHINEFLILTFTNLAAGEMKERIRKKLKEFAPNEAKRIDNAYISTFDSFSLAVLKKYHTLLNVSKDISVMDENSIKIFVFDQIDIIFERLYKDEDSVFINLINKCCYRDDEALKDLVYDLFNKASKAPDTKEYLNKVRELGNTKYLQQYLMEYEKEIDLYVDDIKTNLSFITEEKYVQKLNLEFNAYDEASNFDEKVTALKNIKFPRSTKVEEKEVVEYIKQIKSKLESALESFISVDEYFKSGEENYLFTQKLIDIVEEIIELDYEYKSSLQCFSFSDIAKMSINLLKNNPQIAQELRDSFKTIMIDEYQDTSPIQEEFISLISNNNVYMVGDVKQSIYRFRDATPKIFIDKFNNYRIGNGGTMISLSDNYRSRGEVLDDINHLFSNIMTERMGGADYSKDHIIGKGNKAYLKACDEETNYHYEKILYNKLDADKDEIEARLIAQDIIKKFNSGYLVYNGNMDNPGLRKIRLSDFCILLDRGTNFDSYKRVFNEYGIPLFIENNVDISENQVIMAITSLLKMANFIEENDFDSYEAKHAYLSLSRSFIFEEDDEVSFRTIKNNQIKESEIIKIVTKLWNEYRNDGVYSFITNSIYQLKIYQKLIHIGDVRVYEKYLDNFLSSLKLLDEQGYDIKQFIHYFERILDIELKIEVPSSSTEYDAVKLMNIFKSKGLEFPIIYCAGLTKEFNREKYKNSFLLSENKGIIYPTRRFEHSFIFNKNKSEEIFEDVSEKIRLFYVALTRAKEKFIILLPSNLKVNSIENAKSLSDFIAWDLNKKTNVTSLEEDFEHLNLNQKETQKEMIIAEDVEIESIILKRKKASKKLSFVSTKELLDRGEELHLYLEMIDFKNPDYSLIKPQDKKLIESFINSPLIKNLINPVFYKEYEFIDEKNNTIGIIDCLIIDGDKAYIIDYKLKNIDDDAYLEQIRVYKDVVNVYFKKEAECYLYSILDCNFRKIQF